MDIEFVAPDAPFGAKSAVAVLAFEDGKLSGAAQALDAQLNGAIARAIGAGRFAGKVGQTLDLVAPQGLEASRVILTGGGPQDAFNADIAETAFAHAYQAVKASGADTLAIRAPGAAVGEIAQAAFGVRLAAWRFDRHRTTLTDDKKPSIARVTVAVADPAAAVEAFAPWSALADAVIFARDLVMEPANIQIGRAHV